MAWNFPQTLGGGWQQKTGMGAPQVGVPGGMPGSPDGVPGSGGIPGNMMGPPPIGLPGGGGVSMPLGPPDGGLGSPPIGPPQTGGPDPMQRRRNYGGMGPLGALMGDQFGGMMRHGFGGLAGLLGQGQGTNLGNPWQR